MRGAGGTCHAVVIMCLLLFWAREERREGKAEERREGEGEGVERGGKGAYQGLSTVAGVAPCVE